MDLTRYSINSTGKYCTSFHFIYNSLEELYKAGFIIGSVFGSEYCSILNIDKDESIGTITIPCITQELIETLYDYYDDEIRILFINDELIIGTDKHLNEMGL